MIRVLIAEDSAVMGELLSYALGEDPALQVIGIARDGLEATEQARQLRPDLIVIDLAMPVLNGIVATSLLKQIMPAVSIVMFTSFSNPHIKRTAMAAGLDAFVDKSESPETLLGCIELLLVQRSDSAA